MAWERETPACLGSWLSFLAQRQAVTVLPAERAPRPPHPSAAGALGTPRKNSRRLLGNAD